MGTMQGTLTEKVKPIEILGMGKGFKWAFNQKPEENSSDETYKANIEDVARALGEAVTAHKGVKHLAIPDEASRVPIFFVKLDDDITPYTRYVVFASTVYAGRGQHLRGVAVVQDDSCDSSYGQTILENFVNSL